VGPVCLKRASTTGGKLCSTGTFVVCAAQGIFDRTVNLSWPPEEIVCRIDDVMTPSAIRALVAGR
jgi:hypothetical protein